MRTNTMQLMALAAVVASLSAAASAATTITVDSVVQRWPWNNKVDITYKIGGEGQDVASSRFLKVKFTTTINGETYAIDGVHDVGASADTGTHTVTWTAPAGLKCSDCTMSAAVYSATVPSGDDYMVIDLGTGEVSFEGLLATQADSNARYNTAEYKTDKMVLRKIPAGTYTVGDNNSGTGYMGTKTTAREFYAGVFPVTQYQYSKITGANPSLCTATKTGNTVDHRPVENVSWNTLRRPDGFAGEFAPTSAIPRVATADTGNFFQRLNYLAGNRYAFDLPTEIMAEIAIRAGNGGVYYWSGWDDTTPANYVIAYGDFSNVTGAVGLKKPNAWGLYDVSGNVWEWCLDDDSVAMAKNAEAFVPAWNQSANRRKKGMSFKAYAGSQTSQFRAGTRSSGSADGSDNVSGFRVFWIVD